MKDEVRIMKYELKFLRLTLILLAFLALLFIKTSSIHAAASLSLSPGSANVAIGQKFTVVVNVNTGGEAVNAVEVVINYPADKLTASYISDSGSSFDIKAESTLGAGVVKIARGKIPPAVSGFRRVASVGFVAKSQGSAAISISGDSKVLRESDSANILTGAASATFNITAMPVYTTPADASEQDTQKPAADTTRPKIDGIQVLNLGVQTATIFWKTDEAADSQVEYGYVTDRVNAQVNYIFNAQNADLVTEHLLQLDSATLVPGSLYHFKVESKDAVGNLTEGEDMTFVVPGYPLVVSVLDKVQKPVSGAQVSVVNIGVESTTDKSGQANFVDLPVGAVTIAVTYREKTHESEVNLNADSNEVTIVLDQKVSNMIPLVAVFPIILLVLITIGFVIKYRLKKDKTPPMNLPC